MSLVRWEPFRELMSLREAMDRLFEESFIRPGRLLGPLAEPTVALDMYQTDKEIVVKTAVPGVKPEELDISIAGDTLTIRGESKQEEKIERQNYFCQERRYGSFSRSVTLPAPVEAEKAEAKFEHGILTLTIPKAEQVRPQENTRQNGQVVYHPFSAGRHKTWAHPCRCAQIIFSLAGRAGLFLPLQL